MGKKIQFREWGALRGEKVSKSDINRNESSITHTVRMYITMGSTFDIETDGVGTGIGYTVIDPEY